MLKQLGFSINEMKDVLFNIKEENDLQDYLIEKKYQIQKQIQKNQQTIQMIDTYLKPPITQGGNKMKYEISIETIDEQLIAYIPFLGHYENCSEYFPKLFKAGKSKVCGAPFNMYYDGEYKEEATIESCIPIKERFQAKDIYIKTLSKSKVLKTTHIGKYEQLSYAYKAIIDYAKENKIELSIPSREYYLKGPGLFMKGNPDKYITEILIPIK